MQLRNFQKSGKSLWSSGDASGWLRGLAVGRDVILIGDTGRAVRMARDVACGGVYVVDRRTFKTLDYLDLMHCGAVCEIRLLDEADECHGMGPFTGTIPIDAKYTELYFTPRRLAKLEVAVDAVAASEWTLLEGALVERKGQLCGRASTLCIAMCNIPEGEAFTDGIVSAVLGSAPTPLVQLVGLAARYQGPGDERMYVALIEFYGGNGVLKLLVHDGRQWRPLFGEYLGRNPTYRLAYTLEADRHRLKVDGEVRADLIDATLAEGRFGVRLDGGRISEWAFRAAGRRAEGSQPRFAATGHEGGIGEPIRPQSLNGLPARRNPPGRCRE